MLLKKEERTLKENNVLTRIKNSSSNRHDLLTALLARRSIATAALIVHNVGAGVINSIEATPTVSTTGQFRFRLHNVVSLALSARLSLASASAIVERHPVAAGIIDTVERGRAIAARRQHLFVLQGRHALNARSVWTRALIIGHPGSVTALIVNAILPHVTAASPSLIASTALRKSRTRTNFMASSNCPLVIEISTDARGRWIWKVQGR